MIGDMLMRSLTNAAFRFLITVDGVAVAAFTECKLPDIEWDLMTLKEGGLNTYVHRLAGPRKETSLTLKNGVGSANVLLSWYLMTMNQKYMRRTVTVTLFNSLMMPMMVWHIENALPIKWSGPDLKTDDNTVAIEELQLACGEITVL